MFYTLAYIFCFILVLMYPQATLCMECYKSCMGKTTLSVSEKIICWLPLYNLILIRKSFYGRATTSTIIVATSLAFFAFRMVVIFALYSNELVVALSSVLMITSMGLIYFLLIKTVLGTAILVRSSGNVIVLSVVLPPLGAYLVSRRVSPYMRSVSDELKGTFKGERA